MKRIVVTGATGLIGRAVVSALAARGDQPIALTRDAGRGTSLLGPDVEVGVWRDPAAEPPPADLLRGTDAIVNLLGEPISQRWTNAAKERIRASRVFSTRNLVAAMRTLEESVRPPVLVSQSATGYYGPLGDQPVDESAPAGSDFLADIVRNWESEALAGAEGVRVVVTRTGVVLAPAAGALAKMLPPFKLGIGGPIAGGRQFLPWVHVDDVVGAILRCVDDDQVSGPVNVSAPTPVDNAEFSRTLGRVLHRPAFMPVPAFAMTLLYGEMAEIITTGQRAIPVRLTALGYEFRYPTLEPALADVLAR